jgi:hypothetical protein
MFQYIYLAVAVIVVLGVAIVGLRLIRRRRKDDRVELESALAAGPEDAGAPAVSEPQTPIAQNPTHEAASPNGTSQSTPAPLLYSDQSAIPACVIAASAGGNGSAPRDLLADPLGAVLANMLDGSGKLSGWELKRLDVFRPERIELAARAMGLPPQLEDDEDAIMRLAQIQLYAATLELKAKWASQMPPSGDGGAPDVPFSARDFKLKMARDIMALPASDRSEVIGFLLGGLLASNGSSPELKRAVIDTLEHLRSAALVNVLLDCLDDPDPIVQDYALAAADRLLGD